MRKVNHIIIPTFLIFLIVSIISIAFFFNYQLARKEEKARLIVSSLENSLHIGDYRTVAIQLSKLSMHDFILVELINNKNIVDTINLAKNENDGLLKKKVFVPVSKNPFRKSNKTGVSFYYYQISNPVVFLVYLIFIFYSLYLSLSRYKIGKLLKEREKEKEKLNLDLINLSKQVAHDIRSPLTALEMSTKDLSGLPEESRLIIKGTIQRIHDIANQLLNQKNRDTTDGKSVYLLTALIENLLTEKRTQFRSKPNVQINGDFNSTTYGLFAEFEGLEFKRVLSNLINNAAEALPNHGGCIDVKIKDRDEHIIVEIIDNGKGIPSEVLNKLNSEKSFSYGKVEGNGLGLPHARKIIKSMGGTIDIQSQERTGTCVSLTLAKCQRPAWFIPELTISKNSEIIILDDDPSIHSLWMRRFNHLKNKIRIHHFYSPNEFDHYFIKRDFSKQILILSDYELTGYERNGLDLIEANKLSVYSILVTSHYEDHEVRARCKRLGVKLIPKELVGKVPLTITSNTSRPESLLRVNNFDAVHLDDDKYIRMAWEIDAKKMGISLCSCKNFSQLKENLNNFTEKTKFYIDQDLDEDIKGLDVVKFLYNKGFRDIYISSGHEESYFKQSAILKGIIGKDSPFI